MGGCAWHLVVLPGRPALGLGLSFLAVSGLVVVDPDLELRGVSCDEWLWCAVAAPGAIPRHLRNIRASRGLPRTRKRAGSSCAGGSRTAPSASGRRRTDPSSPRGAPAAGRDQRGRRPKRELRETKFNSFA